MIIIIAVFFTTIVHTGFKQKI